MSEPTAEVQRPRRVCDMAVDERPRERLARHGAGALSNRELLALVLGTGHARESALDVAERLAASGLRELATRGVADLEAVAGLGPAKATRLVAAFELGSRAAAEPLSDAPAFDSPAATGRWLLPRYASRPLEVFGLLALDTRHRLRKLAEVSQGCLTSSLVHPREVFREAVVARAAAVILFHNHPSGDPEPSAEDLSLTRRLCSAGGLMGIPVLDHVILGAARFVSLKERGHV
ncbi:MAG: DNA repair protein RadC [Vicinamibacteria bacterium]|nr:DNA repair protein RadC [Vicinamibacteria bacterium]